MADTILSKEDLNTIQTG